MSGSSWKLLDDAMADLKNMEDRHGNRLIQLAQSPEYWSPCENGNLR